MKGQWVKVELTKAFPNIIKNRGADLDQNGKIEGHEKLSSFSIDSFKKYYLTNRTAIEKRVAFFKHAASLDPTNMQVDNPLHDLMSIESGLMRMYVIKISYAFLKEALQYARGLSAIKRMTTSQQRISALFKALAKKNIRIVQSNDMLCQGITSKLMDSEMLRHAIIGLAYQMGIKPMGDTDQARQKLISRFYYLRSISRVNNGNRAGAIGDLNTAIAIDRKNTDAFIARAAIFINTGKTQAAMKDLNQAIRLDPKNTQALVNRAHVKRALGDTVGARTDMTMAITTNPGAFVNQIRGIIAQGRLQAALRDCTHIIKLAPKQVVFYILRASIKAAINDTKGALRDCTIAVNLKPRSAPIRFTIARIRIQAKDNLGACKDLDMAIKLDPKLIAARFERAILKAAMKDIPGAFADLNTIIRLQPKDAQAYVIRAQLFAKQQNYAKAIADFTAALGIRPDLSMALYGRADAKLRMKDFSGAERDFSAIIKNHPNAVLAIFLRGRIRLLLKKYKDAVADLEKVIKLKPASNQAKQFLKEAKRNLALSQ